ncbi:MAG: oligopeptide/dipeptide ABC transporter ATP-binding protein [Myxococcota bacterium]
MSAPLLELSGVRKSFPIQRGLLQRTQGQLLAVDEVSFSLKAGETLGLVGESGSGKTTIGRLVMGFLRPDAGQIRLSAPAPKVQMVFQDPASSLNPRHRVRRLLADPLALLQGLEGSALEERAQAALAEVGLLEEHLDRLPHQLSGGQRQRVAIARALTADPELLVLDEALAALDLSVRAQMLNLLLELRRRGLAYLFISHDLGQVRHLADQVVVLYLGTVVERGPAPVVLHKPAHPYTLALLEAEPSVEARAPRRRLSVIGELELAEARPQGCVFHPRCPRAEGRCREEKPAVTTLAEGREVWCHYPEVS